MANKKQVSGSSSLTRRGFLKGAAAGAGVAMFHIVPAEVLGGPNRTAANDKINVACVGVGGRGRASVDACANENIVALCDVDDKRGAGSFKKFPKAQKFRDFRKMLDALDSKIDAVTVGIPDHSHAVVVTDALRRGKHVYCEKPLTHSVHEARAIANLAKEMKVITQLGNQGHSSNSIRDFVERIQAGAIGNVTEVHASCDAFPHVYCQMNKLSEVAKKHEIPKHLDYDIWLGPAQHIDYSPLWVPWNWRGWMPFGTGPIGDFACHVLDPAFWALDLGSPKSIKAEVDPSYDPVKHALVYPPGAKITYKFPAKGNRGPITLIWFDGKMRKPKPEKMDAKMPGTGAIIYGDKGAIVHGSHGAGGQRFISNEQEKSYKNPPKTLPRGLNHHRDWLDGIRSGHKSGSDFTDYGAPLTEVALLGALAVRFAGQELYWDSRAMKVTNVKEANAVVQPEYRKGWKLA